MINTLRPGSGRIKKNTEISPASLTTWKYFEEIKKLVEGSRIT